MPDVPHQQKPQYSMDINPEMMVPSSIHPTTPANINRTPGPAHFPVGQLSVHGQPPSHFDQGQLLCGAQATDQFQPMPDQYMRQPYSNVNQVQAQPIVSQQESASFHQGMSTDVHVIIDYYITNCVFIPKMTTL